MTQKFSLNVNGKVENVEADDDMPLLYALRNEIGLNNPHFGCGLAQCGACTVLVQGQATRSCVTPVSAALHKDVVTLEGLGTPDHMHPIQEAFREEQAAQCGYCINGMIMNAKAFLDRVPHPNEEQIREALSGILCRCGTHLEILRAVQRAAGNLRKP